MIRYAPAWLTKSQLAGVAGVGQSLPVLPDAWHIEAGIDRSFSGPTGIELKEGKEPHNFTSIRFQY